MDERKEFRAWCESLTESDWLIAQSFEESFFLGAWAAWRHLRTALAAATERAEAAADELERVREAVRWALGENGEFRLRGENEGAYWWRSELRRRAFPEPPAPEVE